MEILASQLLAFVADYSSICVYVGAEVLSVHLRFP